MPCPTRRARLRGWAERIGLQNCHGLESILPVPGPASRGSNSRSSRNAAPKSAHSPLSAPVDLSNASSRRHGHVAGARTGAGDRRDRGVCGGRLRGRRDRLVPGAHAGVQRGFRKRESLRAGRRSSGALLIVGLIALRYGADLALKKLGLDAGANLVHATDAMLLFSTSMLVARSVHTWKRARALLDAQRRPAVASDPQPPAHSGQI